MFDARLQQALAFIESKGVRRSTAAPPLYRLFWRMGLKVPPPLMASFPSIALLMGGFFGLFWGLLMWLLMWGRTGMPVAFGASIALLAGALFGLLMAAVLRSQARNKQIPAWKDFAP
ncbi:DUF6404 family protein [Pseudoxanthomonas sp. LjRoot143]|uniref:DUF6404 family protein n=1 Tax=Pseudoxanthomonas sp. LjRoot143 TaxID=3342266 RepID=UPI003F50C6E3